MSKEYTATATQEFKVETNKATMPNDGEAVINGVRFYCRFIDGGRLICTSIGHREEVQLNPPKNSYFYLEAIEQLTNGFQD